MTVLLDANVLIALLVDDHVHHVAAENWFVGISGNFATCPLPRAASCACSSAKASRPPPRKQFSTGHGDARHEFWPDDVGYADVPIQGIIGHRQVTDAYLAQLAGPAVPARHVRPGDGQAAQ